MDIEKLKVLKKLDEQIQEAELNVKATQNLKNIKLECSFNSCPKFPEKLFNEVKNMVYKYYVDQLEEKRKEFKEL